MKVSLRGSNRLWLVLAAAACLMLGNPASASASEAGILTSPDLEAADTGWVFPGGSGACPLPADGLLAVEPPEDEDGRKRDERKRESAKGLSHCPSSLPCAFQSRTVASGVVLAGEPATAPIYLLTARLRL